MELLQHEYLNTKSDDERRALGQYFTSPETADYMASMISATIDAPVVRILDAGAGAGALSMAVAHRCMQLGNMRTHAVLYELDEDVIAILTANMRRIAKLFQARGGKFTFEVHCEDFVLARPDQTEAAFHISSINPPYFKYNSKTSPYAGATADLYKGNPNIYASFMAVVAACMAPTGQMLAIVPRSFTNGLYFKGFRTFLNRVMSLDSVHVFQARNKVFKDLAVLQENVICSYTKRAQTASIEVRASIGIEDLKQVTTKTYPAKLLIDMDSEHEIIRIPESAEHADILRIVEGWPANFQTNGYFISTGPVVEHRAQEYVTTADNKDDSVPLLRMHNVRAFQAQWTGCNPKDARFKLLAGHKKHTTLNRPYVLLKRFSAKDERRRLVASVHDPSVIKGKHIALENHLNYVGRADGELCLTEAYGLAALFNSTLMDQYFRCISGSTQVNATEIRLLKLPTRAIICRLGEAFLHATTAEQSHIDSIVSSGCSTTGAGWAGWAFW